MIWSGNMRKPFMYYYKGVVKCCFLEFDFRFSDGQNTFIHLCDFYLHLRFVALSFLYLQWNKDEKNFIERYDWNPPILFLQKPLQMQRMKVQIFFFFFEVDMEFANSQKILQRSHPKIKPLLGNSSPYFPKVLPFPIPKWLCYYFGESSKFPKFYCLPYLRHV